MSGPMPAPAALRKRLAALLLGGVLVVLALAGPVDRLGEDYLSAGLQRALATFALARGLNAAISVVQGTEVAVQPAGVGVVLTPGEILDPVNDLIERFSWVMLMAGASLGLQKLLLGLAAHWLFGAVLVAAWLLLAVSLWWQRETRGAALAGRALMILLVLRFAVPLVALANEGLHRLALADEYRQAESELASTTSRLGRLTEEELPTEPGEAQGLADGVKRWYQSAVSGLDVRARLQTFEAAASDAVESALRLIALFVLQTLVLPLGFLWVLLKFVRMALGLVRFDN